MTEYNNSETDMALSLTTWFSTHARDLPWRRTQDPYLIWLSEVILQQTRVAQGMPYYHVFAEKYPNIQSLAAAPNDEVMRLWQGLGYYRRAENMLATARMIMRDHMGIFPDTYAGLIQLRGIGPYTAAAIASFAFGEAVPVVDGNVLRVATRYYGLHDDITKDATRKKLTALLQHEIPATAAGTFNQAIMELGALVCMPRSPLCQACPLSIGCVARKLGLTDTLPVKAAARKATEVRMDYLLLITEDGRVALRRREGKGIWKSLYEFILSDNEPDINTPLYKEALRYQIHSGAAILHKLTHRTLSIHLHRVYLSANQQKVMEQEGYVFYTSQQYAALPKPIVLCNIAW